MDETSLSLLERVRQSTDSKSWERLVELYTPLIRQWLQAYEVQDADANDLSQDVLTVVAREMHRFDHNQRAGAFRKWLRTILVHRLRHFWRSRAHQPLATGTSSLWKRLDQLEDDASPLSRIWNEQYDRDVIARLIELVRPTFLPKTWEAFHRQMYGGQRPEQVAKELQIPLGSVYMARHRVLNALRREAAGLVDAP